MKFPTIDARLLRATVMANGTVEWFNITKGFGFIAPAGTDSDLFVHISAIEQSGLTGLAEDQYATNGK